VTAADVLAQLRAAGCDLMVHDGELYSRGFDWTLDEYAETIGQYEEELIALLEQEAVLAEAERVLREMA